MKLNLALYALEPGTLFNIDFIYEQLHRYNPLKMMRTISNLRLQGSCLALDLATNVIHVGFSIYQVLPTEPRPFAW